MVLEWIVIGGVVAAAALAGAGAGYYASRSKPQYLYPGFSYYQPAYYYIPRPTYFYTPCW